eukprot:747259-Hanusia_phi.AAC.7
MAEDEESRPQRQVQEETLSSNDEDFPPYSQSDDVSLEQYWSELCTFRFPRQAAASTEGMMSSAFAYEKKDVASGPQRSSNAGDNGDNNGEDQEDDEEEEEEDVGSRSAKRRAHSIVL